MIYKIVTQYFIKWYKLGFSILQGVLVIVAGNIIRGVELFKRNNTGAPIIELSDTTTRIGYILIALGFIIILKGVCEYVAKRIQDSI
jgi:hypothetical protein